jgi:outer membrane biosynthesis protein TonB
MRVADGGRYAFRWRADYAVAGLDPDSQETVDAEPPSPYLDELIRVRRERDDALGRADFAEALAEERERLLRLANVPVPATRVAPPTGPAPAPKLDAEGQSVLDVLYASRRNDSTAAEPEPEAVEKEKPKTKPKPAATAKPKPAAAAKPKPAAAAKPKPVPAPKPKPKAARKKSAVAAPSDGSFPTASWPSEVVYLPTPAADLDDDPDGPKWTGYTLERPHPHLSTVEPLADEA